MKILLLKGRSQYNALRIWIDEAKAAFEDLGHDVVLLDLNIPEIMAQLAERLATLGPFDFAFSYTICGEWRSPTGQNIGQIIGGPHLIQYVDHPLVQSERVIRAAPNSAILTVDQSHADVLKSVFGNEHFAYVGFNPSPAIGKPVPLPDNAEAYAASRPTRLLFTGSYYRPEEPLWAGFPGNIREIFGEAADYALSQDWIAPHSALMAALAARGIGPDDEIARTLLPHCFRIHEWVRATRRFQFLEVAAKVKLPITVYGSGYEKDLHRYENMDYRGSADFHETLALMAQSRVLLNVNVNFGEGSHDRPLCAMLAGAVCASEPSTFYDKAFEVADTTGDMTCFRWSSLEDDLERIRQLSENPDALYAMAVRAQPKAIANHTWKSRAGQAIEIARAARASRRWSATP